MKQLAFVIILLFSFHVAGAQTPTRLRLKQLELAPDSTEHVITSDTNRVAQWTPSSTLLSGYITGSGTAGRVPRWTSSSALGDGVLRDDGTLLAINGVTVTGYSFYDYGTSSWRLPVGTTAQQPTGQAGAFRYNSSVGIPEYHNGTRWNYTAPAAGAFTSTRIPYANTNGQLTDNANLVFDATNIRLGLGTATPSVSFQSVSSANINHQMQVYNSSTGTNARASQAANVAGAAGTISGQFVTHGPNYTSGAFGGSYSQNSVLLGRAHFFGASTGRLIIFNLNETTGSSAPGDIEFHLGTTSSSLGISAATRTAAFSQAGFIVNPDMKNYDFTVMGQAENDLFFVDANLDRVAIKNTSPARDFHVTGEARITDLTTDTPTRIVGADADGDLGAITVGAGLILSAGTLAATGTGTVTGSGTTDYIPKFTSSTALGNSVLQESSSKIGIGVTPAHTLDMENATDAIDLPGGTTAQRPTNESELLRYNSDNARVEYADGTNWRNLLPSTSTTGSAILPAGTTGERDGSPSNGYIRYNSTTGQLEAYVQSAWANISASPRSYADMVSSGAAQYTVVSTEVIDTVTNIVASGFTHLNGVLTYTGTTNKNFLVNISAVVGEADTDAATAVLRLYQNSSIKGVSQMYCALQDEKYSMSISRIVTLATNDTLDCRLATGGDWIVSNFYFNVTPID